MSLAVPKSKATGMVAIDGHFFDFLNFVVSLVRLALAFTAQQGDDGVCVCVLFPSLDASKRWLPTAAMHVGFDLTTANSFHEIPFYSVQSDEWSKYNGDCFSIFVYYSIKSKSGKNQPVWVKMYLHWKLYSKVFV